MPITRDRYLCSHVRSLGVTDHNSSVDPIFVHFCLGCQLFTFSAHVIVRINLTCPKCFFGPFRYDGGRQGRRARVLAVPNNGPGQAMCMPSLGSPGSRRGRDRDAADARRESSPRRGSDSCFGPRSAMLARQRAPGGGMDVGGSGEVGERLGLSCGGRTVTCNLSA